MAENVLSNESIPVASKIDVTKEGVLTPQQNTVNVEKTQAQNDILEVKAKNTAKAIKKSGRNIHKKACIMMAFKQDVPEIDLRKFVEMYVTSNNGTNSFEDMENYEIADEVENHLSLKKLVKKGGKVVKKVGKATGKVGKAVAKVASSKIGSAIIGGAVSLVGSPAAGAAIVAGLGKVRNVKEKGKELGLTKAKIEQVIKEPEKVTAVTIQALVPENGLVKALSPLVALEKPMKDILQSKGVSTNKETTIEDLASMFHSKVVKGTDSFDTKWYKNDPMYYEEANYFDENQLEESQAGQIVNDIVTFFAKAKSEPTTPTEVKAKVAVEKIDNQIKKDDQKALATKVENAQVVKNGFSLSPVIMMAVVAVVLFLVMRK